MFDVIENHLNVIMNLFKDTKTPLGRIPVIHFLSSNVLSIRSILKKAKLIYFEL